MMTGGGPNRSTTVLMMYIRSLAFSQGNQLQGWLQQWLSY